MHGENHLPHRQSGQAHETDNFRFVNSLNGTVTVIQPVVWKTVFRLRQKAYGHRLQSVIA